MEHNQGHVQQCARGYGEWRVATDAKVLSGLNGPPISGVETKNNLRTELLNVKIKN